jgi:hypothetical protein
MLASNRVNFPVTLVIPAAIGTENPIVEWLGSA